jgi:hypothetical protein
MSHISKQLWDLRDVAVVRLETASEENTLRRCASEGERLKNEMSNNTEFATRRRHCSWRQALPRRHSILRP